MAGWWRAGQKFHSSLWINQRHTGNNALRDQDENAHQNRNSYTSIRQSQFFLWEHLIYDYNAYLNLRLLQFPKDLLKGLSNSIVKGVIAVPLNMLFAMLYSMLWNSWLTAVWHAICHAESCKSGFISRPSHLTDSDVSSAADSMVRDAVTWPTSSTLPAPAPVGPSWSFSSTVWVSSMLLGLWKGRNRRYKALALRCRYILRALWSTYAHSLLSVSDPRVASRTDKYFAEVLDTWRKGREVLNEVPGLKWDLRHFG